MSDEALLAKRARQLRFNAKLAAAARVVFIPAVALYSLFLLRPREGHFLRYIAERRHFDPAFDKMFPPLLTPATSASATGKSSTLKQPKVNDDDHALRRKLMFKRDSNGVGEHADAITTTTLEDLKMQLTTSSARPPMSELIRQLQEMSRSKRGELLKAGVAPSELPAHPVSIDFREHWLWSTAQVQFSHPPSLKQQHKADTGTSTDDLFFVGICGTIWLEWPSSA